MEQNEQNVIGNVTNAVNVEKPAQPVKKRRKKMRISLKTKLLVTSILPLLVLIVVSMLVFATKMRSTMQGEIKNGLIAVCESVRDNFNQYPGNYEDVSGYQNDGLSAYKVKKGSYVISDQQEYFNNIKKESGYEVTFFVGNRRYLTTVKNEAGDLQTGTITDSASVIQTVLENGEGLFNPQLRIAGQDYYVYYMPVFNNDGSVFGMMFAGYSNATVEKTILNVILMTGLVSGAVILASIALIVLQVIGISKSIKSAVIASNEVSKGDLTAKIDKAALIRMDEIGDVCRALNRMKTYVRDLVLDTKKQAVSLSDTSDELMRLAEESEKSIMQVDMAVTDIAKGATEQAQDTTDASTKVSSIRTVIEKTDESIDNMSKISEEMREEGNNTSQIFAELDEVNQKVASAVKKIHEQVIETNKATEGISEASSAISDIAEQTNLLSLNASIEAARAGEAGRGFAVVANEISNLARQSGDSSNQIDNIVTSLIEKSGETVRIMEEVNAIISDQAEKLKNADESFSRVEDGIQKNDVSMKEMVSDIDNLKTSTEEILRAIDGLASIAQENAASSQETSAAANQMEATVQNVTESARKVKEIIQKMDESMKRYKVE